MTAELRHVLVGDAAFRKRNPEGRFREVRHAARPGRRAHVDEQLDMIEGEQLDELIERSCRVPDRQDDSCEGSTAGTRTRFTYCEPL